ncbi:tetratricopeptide repeat protein [Streptomyces sp. NPDC002812]|uniref:tetratricopeptide repeat protein n=1 Tax=unclassified Streptomyces TaxID=2593676 RepID=UPI0020305834|nr:MULTISPECIES: tetratricopeptide repeat protein [unclassified Streptomyces]MCM1971236.1 tetratricopeptide repeat protein [Streptomyces sp. G1]MCX5295760.1 tetratricopeptide repeat protein [Streptomyces sp. NBC_00193]
MQPRNMSMSGVVDLAAVKAAGEAKAKAEQARAEAARKAAQGGAPAPAGAVPPSALVFDTDETRFESHVVPLSGEVPVILDFRAEGFEQGRELSLLLERLTLEANGRLALAALDVAANQNLIREFRIQALPAVFAVVAGQAMPLFQDLPSEGEVRGVLAQLVQIAEERFGVIGVEVDPGAEGAAAPGPGAVEAEEPAGPYDALLDEAIEALDADDLDGAVRAYKNVLAADPSNTDAKLGLAQTELFVRVKDMNPQAVRAAAAENPKDPAAQIAAADLDLAGGHVADAFGRLVDTVKVTFGEDRDAVRVRLLEMFEVVGPDNPLVTSARTALARVLF